MNEAYMAFFKARGIPPIARITVGCTGLALGAQVELDGVAYLPPKSKAMKALKAMGGSKDGSEEGGDSKDANWVSRQSCTHTLTRAHIRTNQHQQEHLEWGLLVMAIVGLRWWQTRNLSE